MYQGTLGEERKNKIFKKKKKQDKNQSSGLLSYLEFVEQTTKDKVEMPRR